VFYTILRTFTAEAVAHVRGIKQAGHVAILRDVSIKGSFVATRETPIRGAVGGLRNSRTGSKMPEASVTLVGASKVIASAMLRRKRSSDVRGRSKVLTKSMRRLVHIAWMLFLEEQDRNFDNDTCLPSARYHVK